MDDLEVALEEGVIIFDNYFAVCATDLSALFCNTITCFCVFACIITSLDFDLIFTFLATLVLT
jgi:hypothetical protein